MFLEQSVAVVFCLVTICSSQGPGGPPPEPTYTLNFDSPVYVCLDEESQSFVDLSAVEVLQYNETTAMMSGVVRFLKGMNHDTMVLIEVLKESPGGRYEMMVTHEVCDLCEEISKEDGDYKPYLQYFGFPDKCPFDAGEYPINDLVADTSAVPVNKGNVGRYLVVVNIYKDNDGSCKNDLTFLCCVKLDLIIAEN